MPKKWEQLAKKIEKQYENKHYPHKVAERIGYATATKILKKKR